MEQNRLAGEVRRSYIDGFKNEYQSAQDKATQGDTAGALESLHQYLDSWKLYCENFGDSGPKEFAFEKISGDSTFDSMRKDCDQLCEKTRTQWAEEERKQKITWEKEKKLRNSGLCQHCGGKLKNKLFTEISYYTTFKCKTCGQETTFTKNFDPYIKKLRFKKIIAMPIAAIISAILLCVLTGSGAAILLLIPFLIVFFVPYRSEGFARLIRITSLVVQIIATLSIIISNSSSIAVFGLLFLCSIILNLACFMAYKQPLSS